MKNASWRVLSYILIRADIGIRLVVYDAHDVEASILRVLSILDRRMCVKVFFA